MAVEIQRWWAVRKSTVKNISLLSGYIFLVIAIVTGISSNGYLKITEGFSKLGPTLFCLANMVICIFCLSKAMTVIPVGFFLYTSDAADDSLRVELVGRRTIKTINCSHQLDTTLSHTVTAIR